MGFLFADATTVDVRAGQEAALFHRMGCDACPLRERPGRMEPTGATHPRIYCIGEAPGATEIEKGEQFVGEAGQLLRPRIPKKWLPLIRWNNTVRSRPPKNRTPERSEIECFPSGTLVSPIGKIKTLYRRDYNGPIFMVMFKSGRLLSGTPNHPVFAGGGQIPLKSLKVGDYVFCASNSYSRASNVRCPDGYDMPIPINEVFSSFAIRFGMERVLSAPLDFHGDGIVNSYVDIVRPHGNLGVEGNLGTNFFEKSEDSFFSMSNFCSCGLILKSSLSLRNFILSVIAPFFSIFDGMGIIPRGIGLRDASDFYSLELQMASKLVSIESLRLSNLFGTFSRYISGNHIGFGYQSSESTFNFSPSKKIGLRSGPKSNSILEKKFSYGCAIGSSEILDETYISPLGVEFDQVVSIEVRRDFRGHVYNLETESNRYVANGIVVSNCCRPSIVDDIEKSKPTAIFGFGNIPLTWVSGFSGITMWRGRRMPVRVGKHSCWYYPMLHPSYLLRQRRKDDRERGGTYIGSEDERMFVFDLERAFDEVEVGLPLPDVHDEARARKGVEVILAGGEQGVSEIELALEWAASLRAAGMDYETNALRPYTNGAKILTAAVGTEERSIAFPIHHREARFTSEQKERIIKAWKRFLASKTIKYVHNLAFEMEWTAFFFGEEFIRQPTWIDTATDASILDQRVGKRTTTGGCLSLEFLVQQYFGFNLKQISNMDTKRIDFEPLPKVLSYNGMDGKYHLFVGQKQEIRIKQEGLQEARGLAQRRVPTVVLSQLQGIPVNQAVVKELQKKYRDRIKETEAAIQKVPIVQQFKRAEGHPFNPHSAPEVIDVFYKYLKRKECVIYDKYKKADRLSADETVLSQIDHPLARLMLDLRGDAKRKSTYLDPVAEDNPDAVLYPDGLLHTNYNTFFAETGRLSANDPPVQTYPKRDDEAKEVRLPVEAPKDHVILAFDYGQIQARIVAMFSKDKAFCKALWERYDIHQDWTEKIAHDYPQRIGGRKMLSDKKAMKDFRTDIKNQFTFPMLFGARLESVAGYLNVPVHIMRPHYDAFWRQFSGVKEWQERVIKFYRDYGWVECLTGRRRRGPLSLNELINCVDTETECLSESGWVKYNALREGMQIWTKNVKTGCPELQPILRLNYKKYSGPVRRLGGAANSISTPNHRWLVDVRRTRANILTPTFLYSDELAEHRGSDHRIHLCADGPSLQMGGQWSDDEVRLIGWVLTDGFFAHSYRKNGEDGSTGVGVSQAPLANPHKVKIIEGIFQRLGVKFNRMGDERELHWMVHFDLGRKIRQALPGKNLNASFLSQLSTNQLWLLYENMLLGDGSFDKALGYYTDFCAGTKIRADAFSLLCTLLGIPHNVKLLDMTRYNSDYIYPSMTNSPKMSSYWIVELKRRRRAHSGFNSSWEDFSGDVWCPTVQNGTFFARREGNVYVTGNSPVQGTECEIVMEGMCSVVETRDPELIPELMIHDDLTWLRVPKKRAEAVAEKVLNILLSPPFKWINVPLTIEVLSGTNWCPYDKDTNPKGLQEIGAFSSDTWFK